MEKRIGWMPIEEFLEKAESRKRIDWSFVDNSEPEKINLRNICRILRNGLFHEISITLIKSLYTPDPYFSIDAKALGFYNYLKCVQKGPNIFKVLIPTLHFDNKFITRPNLRDFWDLIKATIEERTNGVLEGFPTDLESELDTLLGWQYFSYENYGMHGHALISGTCFLKHLSPQIDEDSVTALEGPPVGCNGFRKITPLWLPLGDWKSTEPDAFMKALMKHCVGSMGLGPAKTSLSELGPDRKITPLRSFPRNEPFEFSHSDNLFQDLENRDALSDRSKISKFAALVTR